MNMENIHLDKEKYLEATLRREIKKKGGLCLEWVSPGYNGVPDRIVLMPSINPPTDPELFNGSGRVIFVELKSKGVKPTPIQLCVHAQLRDRGFQVEVIDNYQDLIKFLDSL